MTQIIKYYDSDHKGMYWFDIITLVKLSVLNQKIFYYFRLEQLLFRRGDEFWLKCTRSSYILKILILIYLYYINLHLPSAVVIIINILNKLKYFLDNQIL
jgi:hypothetical protein